MKRKIKFSPSRLICSIAFLLALASCGQEQESTDSSESGYGEDLQTRLESLEGSVDNAEALRSIKRLQWAYGHYSELGLWHDFADLFADSGIGHYTQGDLNREQIRELFLEQVGQGSLGLATGRIYPHISFSPVVDINEDGIHAKGRFRILAMLGGYGGGATWFHGLYENAYLKEEGVWKLNETFNAAQVMGNFIEGLSAQSGVPLDEPTFAFHYESIQVGNITTSQIDDAGAASRSSAQIRAAVSSVQKRLNQLDDETAIINLQHQYGYYLDQHDWDNLVDLFAEEGSFETGQQGVYQGKDSIRQAFSQRGDTSLLLGEIDEHIMLQTYVSISSDGQSAKARVDQLGMQGLPGDNAQWTQGIYENSFIKQNGQWRIQSLHYYPRLITDYTLGWGLDAQPVDGPSETFPADAPATEQYEIYPTFYIPAFHFMHPVTGRAPQYPEGNPAIGKSIGFANTEQITSNLTQTLDNSALLSTLNIVEKQAQQALAVSAAENLVNAYAYYLDECMMQEAAILFTKEGVNEIPGIGFYRGQQRIASALQQAYCVDGRQKAALTLHHVVQPIITVGDDGQSITVQSRLWQVHVEGNPSDHYLMGLLEAEVVKEDDKWKLASLSTKYSWVAAIKEGWAGTTENESLGYAAPVQMLTEFPPDLPTRSGRLAPYP